VKKITLLYEASVLANAGKNVSRSGIYFVAYNVLKQLSKNDNLNIVLYIPRHKIRYIKKDGFLSQFPFIVSYSKPKFKENIEIHKSNMKQIFNLDKKIICILKILKNYLCLFFQMFNNHKKRNERLLQSIDIFFTPIYPPNDEINRFSNILHFIILYDIIPLLYPENYPNIEKEDHWYRKLVSTLNKKAYYFCISECTKHDFFKRFPGKLDEEKMIVALIATAQNFYPKYDLKKTFAVFSKYGVEFKPNNKYLFSFCMLDPRKNLYFTLKCYILFIKKHKINDLYFYLGGTETIPFFERLEEAVSDFNEYRDKIAFLGYVDDADVNILYSNALFFTYISQYEGFGMPPLEAMQAGVPVITSNNSSLPEVVGDAAITIDYDSEEQCIKAFEDLYFNEDLRKSCIQKGLERAKLFSWEKTAKIISDTMLTAVEKND
jgi:glycosyltransferase involved in cell wall biosynthesis